MNKNINTFVAIGIIIVFAVIFGVLIWLNGKDIKTETSAISTVQPNQKQKITEEQEITQKQLVINNQENILISFYEYYNENINKYCIVMSMEPKNIGCFKLKQEYKKNQINITIDWLDECIQKGMFGESYSLTGDHIKLNYLENGEYDLNVISNTKVDKYKLSIDDNKISGVIQNKLPFSSLEKESIIRVPDNILEATCYYNSDWKFNPDYEHCNNFFKEIGNISRSFLIAGEGKLSKRQYYIYDKNDKFLQDISKKYRRDNFRFYLTKWNKDSFWGSGNVIKYSIHSPIELDEYEIKDNINKCKKPDSMDLKSLNNFSSPTSMYFNCLLQVAFYKNDLTICEMMLNNFNISNYNSDTCIRDALTKKIYVNKIQTNASICEVLKSDVNIKYCKELINKN